MTYEFAYRTKDDVPACPSCGGAVPTGEESAQAFRLNVRKNGVSFSCLLRPCYCGQELAIDQTRESRWGYAFRCKSCGAYEANLSFSAHCTLCYMRGAMRMKDPAALIAGVREAEVFIPPSRQDVIDGLIKGLLRGAPGLTIDKRIDGRAA